MDERWERVKELFEAALERPEHERSQFLGGACQNDEERHAVESLLSGDKNAGKFLEEPIARISFPSPGDGHPPSTFSDGEIISGRFQILRFIGRGGMGEVYEARDLERNVRVALKTVRPEIASNAKTMARFNKEVDLALTVTHHNVCRVYHLERHRPSKDSGKPEVVFLTMELLEGETLADRLRRQGRMSCAEALPLIRQMAEGLAAAHKERVVHCDFKPGNVMLVSERPADVDSKQSTQSIDLTRHLKRALTPDPAKPAVGGSFVGASVGAGRSVGASNTVRAVITDFGLARAMRPMLTRESIQESLDTGNHLVGTLPYMAPEQLEGHAATPATDVYALGLVVYEMLTGRQPFSGVTPLSAIYKRLQAAPPQPRTLAPGIDAGLEKVILRCLEREPDARYASASELARVLAEGSRYPAIPEWLVRQRVWIAAGLVLLALLLGVLRFLSMRGPKPPAKEENLVVLPFTAVGGRPEEVAYCDGFTIVVTTELAKIPSLTVAPDFQVHDTHVKTVDDARAELGATRVLQGTWQRLGNEIIITLALYDTRTNRQLDARNVDHEANDLHALQNQVVEAAVGMLDVQPPAAAAEGTTQPDAYAHYLLGRGYLERFEKPENLDSAIAEFDRALEGQPSYAAALAGLGEVYWHKYEATHDRQWIALAKSNCEQAVSVAGSSDPNGHICLGLVLLGTGNYQQALEQYQRALQLQPASSDAVNGMLGLAKVYDDLGRCQEAEATYRKAISLRPNYWMAYNAVGGFYYGHGRYEEAVHIFDKVVAIAPDSFRGWSNLGGAEVQAGRYEQGIQYLQRSISVRSTYVAYSNLATAFFKLRRFDEAVASFNEALRYDDRDYVVWGNLGSAYQYAGDHARAAVAFQQAVHRAKERLQVNSQDPMVLADLATYYSALGQRALAFDNMRHALGLAPSDPELLLDEALLYNDSGETERAIRSVRSALLAGYTLDSLRNAPAFDNLRGDARFKSLLEEFGSRRGHDTLKTP